METQKCKKCNQVLSLSEFYTQVREGKLYVRKNCKTCCREESQYNYSLNKAKKEKAIEDAWKEEFKDKIFTCKHCGKEKTFDEMRVNSTNKKMDSRCKACYNKKHKETYKQNYEVKIFEKVLEERRNKQKEKAKK